MKLGLNEVSEGIYLAAKNKVVKQLQHEGFAVYSEYPLENNDRYRLDLFAQKGSDKRIYEFKLGKRRIQKSQFLFLQEYARKIGARLFIIYLETPSSKEITFHGIKDIIFKDFQNDTPDELLNLASRVYIDDIDNIMIHSIDVNGDIIILDGDGTVYIEIEYDSRSDMRNRDGLNEKLQFDFYFRLKLNHYNRKIIHSYYKIDTTWYYE